MISYVSLMNDNPLKFHPLYSSYETPYPHSSNLPLCQSCTVGIIPLYDSHPLPIISNNIPIQFVRPPELCLYSSHQPLYQSNACPVSSYTNPIPHTSYHSPCPHSSNTARMIPLIRLPYKYYQLLSSSYTIPTNS